MVLVFRLADGDKTREWEMEEHFCFESLACWWEEAHRIVGFEFDEEEDIACVTTLHIDHTVSYGPWDVEELLCYWHCENLYEYHHDRYKDFEVVGYKYSEILEEEKQVTYFDLKNGLHLLSWW